MNGLLYCEIVRPTDTLKENQLCLVMGQELRIGYMVGDKRIRLMGGEETIPFPSSVFLFVWSTETYKIQNIQNFQYGCPNNCVKFLYCMSMFETRFQMMGHKFKMTAQDNGEVGLFWRDKYDWKPVQPRTPWPTIPDLDNAHPISCAILCELIHYVIHNGPTVQIVLNWPLPYIKNPEDVSAALILLLRHDIENDFITHSKQHFANKKTPIHQDNAALEYFLNNYDPIVQGLIENHIYDPYQADTSLLWLGQLCVVKFAATTVQIRSVWSKLPAHMIAPELLMTATEWHSGIKDEVNEMKQLCKDPPFHDHVIFADKEIMEDVRKQHDLNFVTISDTSIYTNIQDSFLDSMKVCKRVWTDPPNLSIMQLGAARSELTDRYLWKNKIVVPQTTQSKTIHIVPAGTIAVDHVTHSQGNTMHHMAFQVDHECSNYFDLEVVLRETHPHLLYDYYLLVDSWLKRDHNPWIKFPKEGWPNSVHLPFYYANREVTITHSFFELEPETPDQNTYNFYTGGKPLVQAAMKIPGVHDLSSILHRVFFGAEIEDEPSTLYTWVQQPHKHGLMEIARFMKYWDDERTDQYMIQYNKRSLILTTNPMKIRFIVSPHEDEVTNMYLLRRYVNSCLNPKELQKDLERILQKPDLTDNIKQQLEQLKNKAATTQKRDFTELRENTTTLPEQMGQLNDVLSPRSRSRMSARNNSNNSDSPPAPSPVGRQNSDSSPRFGSPGSPRKTVWDLDHQDKDNIKQAIQQNAAKIDSIQEHSFKEMGGGLSLKNFLRLLRVDEITYSRP